MTPVLAFTGWLAFWIPCGDIGIDPWSHFGTTEGVWNTREVESMMNH